MLDELEALVVYMHHAKLPLTGRFDDGSCSIRPLVSIASLAFTSGNIIDHVSDKL